MKQSLPIRVIVGVIAAFVIGLGLFIWKQMSQPDVERDAQGNLITGIDASKMEKDPAKLKAAMDKLVQEEKTAKGTR